MNKKTTTKKKTRQGSGKYTKHPSKGSACANGGKTSKSYKKKYRGQGRR
jgi:hypothetical protein